MDKVNQKMRKFNLRGVLDNLRSSVQDRQPKIDQSIEETLKSEHFIVTKTVRYGFPYHPTSLAYDPVQNLLAIGTKTGLLRIFGRPGVECDVKHEGGPAVIQLMFLVNEGAILSVCADDTINMWTLRQKKPELIHTLQFQRERITYCHLPFQSKWLYIGTERGNIHVMNLESFSLSGYVINWNKAMELIRMAHPGPVVHISDNPLDANKLLVGFETGSLVLWDLKSKSAETRFTCSETLKSACWHQEGKQFICSHGDGSVTLWNIKNPQRPHSFLMPHSKLGKDGKPEPCKPILKVDYRTVRNAGGTSTINPTPSVTVMHGNSMTVLEMEHPVVDFVTLSSTPWNSDFQDPHAVAVLLQNDLVVVDLNTSGYPCFENPYPMDIHESPVTCCQYFADCPPDLIPAFYSVGVKTTPAGYSEKSWPIHGGEWGAANCAYPEILITGHADGSLKFWDASAGTMSGTSLTCMHQLQQPDHRSMKIRERKYCEKCFKKIADMDNIVIITLNILYKLKTSKIFDEGRSRSSGGSSLEDEDNPLAIQHIYLCVESRLLCVAGSSHVLLFRFNKQEQSLECPTVEVSIVYDVYDGIDSPDLLEFPVIPNRQNLSQVSQQSSYSNIPANGKDTMTSLRTRSGSRKWPAGYQPAISCLLTWNDNEAPPPITSLCVNSRFKLLAFGNECGIAIIDIVQKTCLLSMGTPDLYGSMDPYSRAPRSPKLKSGGKNSEGGMMAVGSCGSGGSVGGLEECRSPTIDQASRSRTASSCSAPGSSCSTPLPCHQDQVIFCPVTLPHATKHLEAIKELSQISESDESDIDGRPRSSSFGSVKSSSTPQSETKLEQQQSETSDSVKPLNSETDKTSLSAKFQAGAFRNKKQPCGQNALLTASLDYRTLHGALQAARAEETPSCDTTADFQPKQPLKKTSSGGGGVKLMSRFRNKSKRDAFARSHSLSVDDPTMPSTPAVGNHFPYHSANCSANTSPLGSLAEVSTTTAFNYNSRAKFFAGADPSKIGCPFYGSEVDFPDAGAPSLPIEWQSESDTDPPLGKSGEKPVGFVRMMSRKLRSSLPGRGMRPEDDDAEGVPRKRPPRPEVINLASDDPSVPSTVLQLDYLSYCMLDRVDNSFSRSHSSSMTSLENVSKEAIESLHFTDVFTRKTDISTSPCLWVGTSLGTVLVISLTLPADGEPRRREPVMVSPSGTIFRLKGSILVMSFLDGNAVPLLPPSLSWKDGCKVPPDDSRKDKSGSQSSSNNKAGMSPTTSTEGQSSNSSQSGDPQQQFAVICSEKQARVIALPSQICLFKAKITETSVVAKADVISLREGPCLSCFIANGHLMTFSLPCLKPLLDVDYIPLPDVRVARTLCFSTSANIIYMCSPSEIQKLCLSAEANEIIKEMQGDLFVPCDMPEAPRQGFFNKLFSAGSVSSNSSIEREELFGESSGKASKGLAKYTAGTAGMAFAQEASTVACSDISRAKMLALERGERLGELDDKTEQMKREAEQFSLSSQQLKNKYKDKKWYQF